MTIPEHEPSDKPELYLALTPYHVFLACGLACQGPGGAELIVYRSVPLALLEAIRAWPDCPFITIETLPSPNRYRSLARQVWCTNRNVARLRGRVSRQPYGAAFIFNDGVAESQAVMHWLKRLGETEINYVEDGMPMYANVSFPHDKRLYKRLLRKLLYGSWWVDVDVLGSTPWVDELWACFPDLVRPQLSTRGARGLSAKWFKQPGFVNLAREFLALLGVDLSSSGKSYALCVLEHSTAVAQRSVYQSMIDKACRQALAIGLTPILKYHPAEPAADPYGLEGLELGFLPKDLGVEFLYVSDLPITVVLGNLTHALVTARWLRETTRVISIAPRLGPVEPVTGKFFADIGVELAVDDEELRDLLAR